MLEEKTSIRELTDEELSAVAGGLTMADFLDNVARAGSFIASAIANTVARRTDAALLSRDVNATHGEQNA